VIPATTLKIDSFLSQQESWVVEDLWRLAISPEPQQGPPLL
jgi:hypothetical protein